MKARGFLWLTIAVTGLAFSKLEAQASHGYAGGFEVRATSDFYEPLSPHGYWVRIEPYGWCWYPAYVSSDWRPYSTGHWLWSDGGWYWVSEEPWAWACYHYGRWYWHSHYGWVWVPGIEWAPSWVCWRESASYIGWAPLPPGCDFVPYRNVIYAEDVVVAPTAFVFVERRRFCEPIRPSILIINHTVIHNTVNITHIKRVNRTIINEGPKVDEIERAGNRRVSVARVQDLRTTSAIQMAETTTYPTKLRSRPQIRAEEQEDRRTVSTQATYLQRQNAVVSEQNPPRQTTHYVASRNGREPNKEARSAYRRAEIPKDNPRVEKRRPVPTRSSENQPQKREFAAPFLDRRQTSQAVEPIESAPSPPAVVAISPQAESGRGKKFGHLRKVENDERPRNSGRMPWQLAD